MSDAEAAAAAAAGDEAPVELKGGHPPAVKVAGGMRIKTNVKAHKEAADKPDKDDELEEGKPNPNDEVKTVVSGVAVKGDKDFPAEAVKSFHDKPLPTVQPKLHVSPQNPIQQPRKQ